MEVSRPVDPNKCNLKRTLDRINHLTNQVHIDEEALKAINTFLLRPIKKDDFLKMIEYLARNPVENIKIFGELQKRALENFDETMDDLSLGINEN
jgi:SET domain-containing protein